MPEVLRSVEIKASPKTVWSLLASQEGLRQWLHANLEIDMREGGAHRHVHRDDTVISGYVLEIVPEQRLVISWFEEGGDWRFPIRLVFTLEAIPDGTRVTQCFDSFAGIGKPTWDRTQQAYSRGTDEHQTLARLKAAAERHAA